MFWRVRLVIVAALLSAPWVMGQTPADNKPAAASAPSSTAAQPVYASNPKFVDAMKDAKLLTQQKRYNFAADGFKKANKIAGGQCLECLQYEYATQMACDEFKDAVATAVAWEALAGTPVMKSAAQARRAMAMLSQAGEKPKPAQLEAVHALLQQAIATNPRNAPALFTDGKVLALMGNMEEAKTDFQQCVKCIEPGDPSRLRAEHFADDPELAVHKMAPVFEVTALDGSKFNLDAMGGRVVLIDFWATWCGPCNEELPQMKKIAKEFAGQPLVIISVSWDSDEAKWKAFVEKNEMTWVQYRDADHKLSDEFGIDAIPHYFTIDSDGVLTAEMVGEGSDVEGKLKKLLAKAREALKAGAGAPNPPSAGN
jgi:thiol-disulfide isomerase/thioredoxin